MTIIRSLLVIALIGCGIGPLSAAVIAHADCGVDSLAKADLKKMWLGKKKTWANGTKVSLAVHKKNPAFDTWLKGNVGKSGSQFKSYWKKMVFTGKGAMPADFASDAEILAHVAATPGAIGVIIEGDGGDGVKVIAVQ